jgi:hypothetical protein
MIVVAACFARIRAIRLSCRVGSRDPGEKDCRGDADRVILAKTIVVMTRSARSGPKRSSWRPVSFVPWEIFCRGELLRARLGGKKVFATYSSRTKRPFGMVSGLGRARAARAAPEAVDAQRRGGGVLHHEVHEMHEGGRDSRDPLFVCFVNFVFVFPPAGDGDGLAGRRFSCGEAPGFSRGRKFAAESACAGRGDAFIKAHAFSSYGLSRFTGNQ